jgi:hypothetical protein
MLTLVLGTVLPWLRIGTGTWLGDQFVRQNGRILLRLEAGPIRSAACAMRAARVPWGTRAALYAMVGGFHRGRSVLPDGCGRETRSAFQQH